MNLNRIFNPKSIAIIGASDQTKSVGWGLMKNILEGKSQRKVFAVNPYRQKVMGIKCLPSILSIKQPIDLAIIAVPAVAVPKIIKECCDKKVGGIIVISAGFSEIGEKGKGLENQILQLTKKAQIPLIGPNCLGIIKPSIKLNASFAPTSPQAGGVGFISQSGAVVDAVVDSSLLRGYGFSTMVSYGNEAQIDISDLLLWLEKDKETKVITAYLEGVKDGRKFMKVAQKVAKVKPIIVIKAGKTEAGIRAASSHTAALSGSSKVYSAAFHQSGVIEVETIEELFGIAKALAWQPRCKNGVAIVTNGGGFGVLMTDYCQELGIKLTELSGKTIQKLVQSQVMNPAFSKRNPLDIVGDALADRYQLAIETLLEQKNIHGLLVIQAFQIMTEVEKNAKIIIEAQKKWKTKPIISVFLGEKFSRPGIDLLEKNRIPNYSNLKMAALAMKNLIK
jgi:acetyltransferase